jgi:multiple sugar transport system permease protein
MRPTPLGRVVFALAVSFVAAWSLAPFLWQLITSLKPAAEVAAVPVRYWPSTVDLTSYITIFKARPFATYMLNSFIVGIGTTAATTLLAAAAAYAFSRLALPGGRHALLGILGLSLFPGTILIVPLKQLATRAGLLNSLPGLMIAYTALNLPFAIWVLKAFFDRLPKDVEEAAWLDGLSRWQTLWKIVLPLSAPAVATTAILVFIFSWNEFLIAQTLVTRDAARTVPVGIAMLSGVTVYEVPWGQIAAAVVVTTLPVVVMVLAFQRRIVEGLTAGAVKG